MARKRPPTYVYRQPIWTATLENDKQYRIAGWDLDEVLKRLLKHGTGTDTNYGVVSVYRDNNSLTIVETAGF